LQKAPLLRGFHFCRGATAVRSPGEMQTPCHFAGTPRIMSTPPVGSVVAVRGLRPLIEGFVKLSIQGVG
jgi:hypothetical protein